MIEPPPARRATRLTVTRLQSGNESFVANGIRCIPEINRQALQRKQLPSSPPFRTKCVNERTNALTLGT